MNPIVNIWLPESSLGQIGRGHFPAFVWKKYRPDDDTYVSVNVPYSWFKELREYENKIKAEDLPF